MIRRAALLALALVCFTVPVLGGVEYERASTEHHKAGTAAFGSGDLPVTVALWFRASDNTTNQWLFSVSDEATPQNYYGIAYVGGVAGDQVRWQAQQGATADTALTLAGITDTTTWHSIVGVEYSTTDRRVYLDGVRGTDNATSISPGGLDNTLVGAIERSSGAENGTNGAVAWCALWKGYAFTDADALAWHKKKHPLAYRPLPANYWPMRGDGPAGTRLRDMVGGLSLTTVGGTPTKTDSPPIRTPAPFYGINRRNLLPDALHLWRCREEDTYALAA